MATRILLSGGTGRMGVALAGLITAADDLELVGLLDREGSTGPGGEAVEVPERAGPLLDRTDVVIDFSAPGFLARLLDAQAERLDGRALLVGTTGLGPDVVERLEAAQGRCAVLVAANFSVGVNVLLSLVEQAGRLLRAEQYDVEIVEAHHRHKVDAPSGTALALGHAVAAGRARQLDEVRRDGRSGHTGARPEGEIGFHALRGGGVVGEHHVVFLGGSDRIELTHVAADRALFAEGALLAARWMVGRAPGRYTMAEILGLG